MDTHFRVGDNFVWLKDQIYSVMAPL